MSRSPTDLYNDGESILNKLSLPASERFPKAADSFNSAAIVFKNARNYQRAGESMRRVVDCYFHIDKQEDAAKAAIECARLYAKADSGFIKMREALDIAINQYEDMEMFEECTRYLIEFSTIYQNAKRMNDSIRLLKRAQQIYYSTEHEFDGNALSVQITDIHISLRRWKEASEQFEDYAIHLSNNSTMNNTHDACAKSIFCKLIESDTSSAVAQSEKLGSQISSWKTSKVYSLVNDIIEACHSRLESRISKAISAFKTNKTCDEAMKKILDNVIKKSLIH